MLTHNGSGICYVLSIFTFSRKKDTDLNKFVANDIASYYPLILRKRVKVPLANSVRDVLGLKTNNSILRI